MSTSDLSHFIKEQAKQLGFDACGFARAQRLPENTMVHYQNWLAKGFQADMHYLERNSEKRYDPTLLEEGCRSVVVVAMNYFPGVEQERSAPAVAAFAYGKDYHRFIRSKLNTLLDSIRQEGVPVQGRAFVDSAPIAERYWAVQAGLGWIGKNRQLIIPGKGSFYFLGMVLVDLELSYDQPLSARCGRCRRCLDACPGKALHEESGLDARRCLSYLTIEKRGTFNVEEAALVAANRWVFGCDVCQRVCPWNRFSTAGKEKELQPNAVLLSMKRSDFEKMTEESFRTFFKGSCLERIGYEGLIRNIRCLADGRGRS